MDKFIAHILVVDDDDGIRSLVKKYLNENNFLITTADSAEDASEKISIIKFDLIILDIMMPGKNGLEFVKDHKKKTPYNEVTELFYQECLKRNFIPGIPVINLIRIAPPLIADDIIIEHALKVMDDCLSVVEKNI